MRAILTLFMVNALLMREEDASLIYGAFLGLCYLTPMLGGFIADRFLGNRNCIMIGGLLMAIGQFLLFTSATVFTTNLPLASMLMWVALIQGKQPLLLGKARSSSLYIQEYAP
jgi:POT family proton-dependent oligopeptide transporter